MAAVFLGLGSALAAVFARRLQRDAAPDLEPVADQAQEAAKSVRRTIRRDGPAPAGGRSDHA
jgi:hypothetical protein